MAQEVEFECEAFELNVTCITDGNFVLTFLTDKGGIQVRMPRPVLDALLQQANDQIRLGPPPAPPQ
jgi:hypothetical protein